jgi:tetratricopeptide (TPR) repeat protein
MKPLRYTWLKLKAQTLLVFGQRQVAIEVFNTMLADWPGDAYALASKAHLLAQVGDNTNALALMQRLTQTNANSPSAWFNFGFMSEAQGYYEQAEAAFRRALALDPELDRAWYGLALVLIRAKRLDEAIDALKQNTKLQPMSPYGWYQLARVHVDRNETAQAEKIIRHLRGFEPKVAAQLERETGITVSPAN